MKNLKSTSLHGGERKMGIGILKNVTVLLLSAGLFTGLMHPVAAKAEAGVAISQLEYLQWLVQLSGDTGQFTAAATPNAYVDWARSRNMLPTGGWQPTALLSRDVLAQTLVQFYNMKVKKDADFVRTLQREGIQVPDAVTISREAFVSMVDEFGFQSRTATVAKVKKSKHKTPTKKPSVKKPTKKATPKKISPKHP